MEEDRSLTDLGTAADIEEAQRQAEPSQPPPLVSAQDREQETASLPRQPKKRFIGRRAADAAASQSATADGLSSSTLIGCALPLFSGSDFGWARLKLLSRETAEAAAPPEPGP